MSNDSNEPKDSNEPRKITIDLKKLKMKDLRSLKSKGPNDDEYEAMIPIIARCTGLTEDEVWDLDFESMMQIQNELNTAMEDVLKKTNAGR